MSNDAISSRPLPSKSAAVTTQLFVTQLPAVASGKNPVVPLLYIWNEVPVDIIACHAYDEPLDVNSTMSVRPSPVKSPVAKCREVGTPQSGEDPPLAAAVQFVISKPEPVDRATHQSPLESHTAISSLPSPLKSPTA